MSAVPGPATPWYRQFWPWFVIAIPAAAVAGSLVTIWIAVATAPVRVDNAGARAVALDFDGERIVFDLGVPAEGGWPQRLGVTIAPLDGQPVQTLEARRLDERHYAIEPRPLEAGAYEVVVRASGVGSALRGTWAYPAPVWKLRAVDD